MPRPIKPKGEAKRPNATTKTRQTRTLTLDKVPLNIREIIKTNRGLDETWQQTVIRMLGEWKTMKSIIDKYKRQ